MHTLVSAASTNATIIKASAGRIYSIFITNPSASWRYVKIYAKATTPVPGTDTPVATFGVAPGSSMQQNWADIGWAVASGITYAIVGGIAANDATAISAGDVAVSIGYI
jgi:hypothetical protein